MSKRADRAALVERINRAYSASGNQLGWRLLASPADVLEGADVAFLGLNPGGGIRPPDHAEFSMSSGSAYVNEQWADHPPGFSPLQRQVRALFQGLAVEPESVLAGNLVPFRSPDWASFENKKKAIEFGMELWRELLADARPKLVIGMGHEVTKALSALLETWNEERVPVGWGATTGTRADFRNGTLIGLPHLSRFRIMLRPDSRQGIRKLFGNHWKM